MAGKRYNWNLFEFWDLLEFSSILLVCWRFMFSNLVHVASPSKSDHFLDVLFNALFVYFCLGGRRVIALDLAMF